MISREILGMHCINVWVHVDIHTVTHIHIIHLHLSFSRNCCDASSYVGVQSKYYHCMVGDWLSTYLVK